MTSKEISNIRRFLGVIEGVAETTSVGVKNILYDYIAVIDEILDREENNDEK